MQGYSRKEYQCAYCSERFEYQTERREHEEQCRASRANDKSYNRSLMNTNTQKISDFVLTNNQNQFNCFINSMLQVMWNVKDIQEAILAFKNDQKYITREAKVINQILAIFQSASVQIDQANQNRGDKAPQLNPDRLRVELFKYHYNTDVEFDLFKKADTTEFLQSILELTHFCLNPNFQKKSVDDPCQDSGQVCKVHQNLNLRIQTQQSCKCKPDSVKIQKEHDNNFACLINAKSVIEYCQTTEMDKIVSKLPKIHKHINTTNDQICINGNKDCLYSETSSVQYINEPYPRIMVLNVNWWHNYVQQLDTLRFSLSIPQRFNINDIFNLTNENSQNTEYVLKSFVVFLGAHYMSFVRQVIDGVPKWKLIDDVTIKIYDDWFEVLEVILETGILPTNLFYEQITSHNQDLESDDNLKQYQIQQLYNKANEMEQLMAQFNQIEPEQSVPDDIGQTQKTEPTSTSSKQSSISVDSPLKQLQNFKKQWSQDNIYLFECSNCSLFMMLHQQQCSCCGTPNIYYDSTLQVSDWANKSVNSQLPQLMQTLGMSSKLKQQSINQNQTNLRRKSMLNVLDADPSNVPMQDHKNEKLQVQQQFNELNYSKPKPKMTVWKCPACSILNKIEDMICNNSQHKKCNYDQQSGDQDPEYLEVTVEELRESRQKWSQSNTKNQSRKPSGEMLKEFDSDQKKKEEDNKMREDQWECEKCKTVNTMNYKDRNSANCKKCQWKNEVIDYMIAAHKNQNMHIEEEELLQSYKNKQEMPVNKAYQDRKYSQNNKNSETEARQVPDMNINPACPDTERSGKKTIKEYNKAAGKEEEYDMRGEFFECKMCDKFTVHKDNESVCQNRNCRSNQGKDKVSTQREYQTRYYGRQCKQCFTKLQTYDLQEQYQGQCQRCFYRSRSTVQSRQKQTLTDSKIGQRSTDQFLGASQNMCRKCKNSFAPHINICRYCNMRIH